MPPEWECLRAAEPRLALLYDLPLLLSSAAALESERKCSVITCCRWHNIAASAAKPPRQTIESLYKSKVDGDCVRLTNRRQSDSEDRSKPSRLDTTPGRHLIPQAAQLFECQSANAKPFSWGSKGDILFPRKENIPLNRSPVRHRGNTLPAQRECCIYFLRSTNFWYCSEIFFRIFSISRLPSSCVSRTKFFVPSLKNSMNASVTMRRVSRSRFL